MGNSQLTFPKARMGWWQHSEEEYRKVEESRHLGQQAVPTHKRDEARKVGWRLTQELILANVCTQSFTSAELS